MQLTLFLRTVGDVFFFTQLLVEVDCFFFIGVCLRGVLKTHLLMHGAVPSPNFDTRRAQVACRNSSV